MKGVLQCAGSSLALIIAGAGLSPAIVHAQATPPMAYGNVDGGDDAPVAGDAAAEPARKAYSPPGYGAGAGGKPRKRTRITPYLEVDQNIYDQTSPKTPVVTYTTVAVGADVTVSNRRTSAVGTIRYEHHFVEKGDIGSSDTVTGIVRGTTDIVPRRLSVDFGGLAMRTAIEPTGGTLVNPADNTGSIYQLWSLYGGPQLSTHAGIVGIKAGYNVGYNEIDQLHSFTPVGGGARVDVFGHSLSQQADISAGVKPGEVLPFGLTASAGWLREDVSNLDQRMDDRHVGLQVMQPISRSVALVGDVGWEKLTVASRDALREASGAPVVAPNGQYVIDRSVPRKLAYKTDGFTWDVGVMWRPSKRTALAAFVGRRYDSTTYYGTFNYTPDSRTTLSVAVIDGIYGFGSGLMTALRNLPTDFAIQRDPFSGNVSGCMTGPNGGGCIGGALGSANAAVFRVHGVNLAYSKTIGRMTASFGGGYISRRFIAREDSILASENGALDQTWYVDAGLSGPIGRESHFYLNGFGSVYHTNQVADAGVDNWGVTGMFLHHLGDRLDATATAEVLGVNRQIAPDQFEMLGQVGLRYSFR